MRNSNKLVGPLGSDLCEVYCIIKIVYYRDFENLAIGVLAEMYSKNKGLTHLALIREMEHWGKVTCLTLADTGEHMDFMGHSACQTRLNKIWRGSMALYTSNLKVKY